MSLIKCPECGKEISDEATNCPHCGYPIKQEEKPNFDSDIVIARRDGPGKAVRNSVYGILAGASFFLLLGIILLAAVPEKEAVIGPCIFFFIIAVVGLIIAPLFLSFFSKDAKRGEVELIMYEAKTDEVVIETLKSGTKRFKPTDFNAVSGSYNSNDMLSISYFNNGKLEKYKLGYTHSRAGIKDTLTQLKNK